MSGTPFFNVNGVGFKGGRVAAIEAAGVSGFQHGGRLWAPDLDGVRTLLPFRWRRAFERETGSRFWYDKHDSRRPANLTIHDRRGRPLTTVYANFNATESGQ